MTKNVTTYIHMISSSTAAARQEVESCPRGASILVVIPIQFLWYFGDHSSFASRRKQQLNLCIWIWLVFILCSLLVAEVAHILLIKKSRTLGFICALSDPLQDIADLNQTYSCAQLQQDAIGNGYGDILDGIYCPEGSNSIEYCPIGNYCEDPASDPIICPAGFYCPVMVRLDIYYNGHCSFFFYCWHYWFHFYPDQDSTLPM